MNPCNRVIALFALAMASGCVPDATADTSEPSLTQALIGTPITVSVPITAVVYQDLDSQYGHVVQQYPTSVWETSVLQRKMVVVVPIAGLPIGATLTNIAAEVQDTTLDGCFFAFYDQFHGSFRDAGGAALPYTAPESAFSIATHSTGMWQSISMQQPFSRVIASGHAYSVAVYFGHQGPCYLGGLEVTYAPAG